MALDDLKNNAKALSDDIQDYVDNRIAYLKLSAYKKSVLASSATIYAAIIGVFLLFTLLFLSFAFATWLSQILKNAIYGYLIVAFIFMICLVCSILFLKTPIQKLILSKFSKLFFDDKI